MRIDGPGSGQNILGLNQPNASQIQADPAAAVTAGPENSVFQPTEGLLSLLASVRGISAVRPDRVAEASRRLASGELLSPQALNQTVQAILRGAGGEGS